MNPTDPDLSSLLPDDATLKARRAALVEAVGSGTSGPEPTPSGRRRPWRLAIIGAAVVAAVVVALVLSSGDGGTTSVAFAVEPQAAGGATIKIYSPEDAAGLEAALAEVGIRSQVNWLPAGMGCREPYFKKSTAKTASGENISLRGGAGVYDARFLEIGIMSSRQWGVLESEYKRGEISRGEFTEATPDITLEPASFRPDQSMVISGFRGPFRGDPEGGLEFHFGVAEGPVEPCEPVSLPGGGLLGLMNRQAESRYKPEPPGAGTSPTSPGEGGVSGG